MTETEPVVVARYEPAYTTQAADIILRAADGTDFRYFKSVLSLASPIFRDMFSLPQPGLSVARPSGSDEPLQILDVHDSAVGLYALLHFCYPALRYEPDTFEAAEGLMTVAHKYCVAEAMEEGWRQIIRFVGKLQPLRAYCVACKLKLGAEARQAAKLVLSLDHTGLLEYQSDLETLSAGDYQRLIDYHQRACVAASQVAASNSFLWVDYSRIYWDHAPTASCPQFRTEQEFQAARTGDDRRIAKSVSLWWKTYMDAVGLALAQHPSAAIPKSESFMQLMRDGSAKCDKCRLDIGRAYLWNEFLSEFENEIEKAISAVTLEVKF